MAWLKNKCTLFRLHKSDVVSSALALQLNTLKETLRGAGKELFSSEKLN